MKISTLTRLMCAVALMALTACSGCQGTQSTPSNTASNSTPSNAATAPAATAGNAAAASNGAPAANDGTEHSETSKQRPDVPQEIVETIDEASAAAAKQKAAEAVEPEPSKPFVQDLTTPAYYLPYKLGETWYVVTVIGREAEIKDFASEAEAVAAFENLSGVTYANYAESGLEMGDAKRLKGERSSYANAENIDGIRSVMRFGKPGARILGEMLRFQGNQIELGLLMRVGGMVTFSMPVFGSDIVEMGGFSELNGGFSGFHLTTVIGEEMVTGSGQAPNFFLAALTKARWAMQDPSKLAE